MGTKIVIVGAGYAGLLTAKKLAKKLKKQENIQITIIDRNPFHTMLTELHEVAAGRVDEDSIKISLKKVFAGRKVDVRLDTVESIDFDGKTVCGACAQYQYDYLVLAAGSKPTFFGVDGADQHARTLWSFDDAVRLKEHILDSFRKAACEPDIQKKKKLLTFYVIGAGFTGIEMVGELAEYVPVLCEKYEIDREFVSLYNVDVLPRIVPILPEKLARKIQNRLAKMHVDLMLNTGVVRIGEDFIELKRGETVDRKVAGTVIWAAGIESSDIAGQAAKVLSSANRGRIQTDKYLRSVDDDHVYIVGDNVFFKAENADAPVPQLVENCEQSSGTAAHNIACAITGIGEMEAYEFKFHGVMVCVGGRYGVARVGTPNHQLNLPSFLAMFSKHFINIIYYIQVLGWNKVFSYMKHEFFTIRHDRSFVGGHFSNKTPSFLLFPLRVWLGMVWLYEGIMKIAEGWLTSPKLKGFFGGADAWYESILNPSSTTIPDATSGATAAGADAATTAVTTAADALSSATGAGEAMTQAASSVGDVLMNFSFLGLFKVLLVSGKDLASSTLSDLAFKLDVPLINWFVEKLILPSEGMQLFMQIFIVVAEILIGLALIGGLFTTISSGGSLILQVMFVCTTGLYLNTFWMVFAAIAVLIGGGRVLGLDYYVQPWLKKHWKRVKFARKLYIYND